MYARRRIATILIVCGLLHVPQNSATGQDYQRYERATEAMRLSQQAETLYYVGRHDEALPLAEKAVALQGDKYSQGHDSYSMYSPYSILGRLYRAKGDYARAEATYLRLLKSMETPPGYLDTMSAARAHNELAAVYEANGDYGRALQSRARGNELIELNLVKMWAPDLLTGRKDSSGNPVNNRIILDSARYSGWEYGRELILNSLVRETDSAVSLTARHLPQDRQATQLALTTILQRKGRLLDARAGQLAILRRYGNQQDQNLIDQLTKVYVQSASSMTANQTSSKKKLDEYLRAVREGSPAAQAKAKAEFEAEWKLSYLGPGGFMANIHSQQEIDGAINRRSAELRQPEPSITLGAVAQALPTDAVLVEFISYRPFNPKAQTEIDEFGGSHYAAYILRRDGLPQSVDLGEATAIDETVSRLLAALRDPRRTDVVEIARALDERIMRPVRKLLGPAQRIFLAPDGALNLLPFSVLIDEKKQYLIENYSVNYLTSGRDLLRLQNRGESRDGIRVFANPLFDLTSEARQVDDQQTGNSANQNVANVVFKDLMSLYFKPLPGTAAEAAALGRLFPDSVLLTEARATESSLKSVRRPRLLHIATHGFFLENKSETARSNRDDLQRGYGRPASTPVGIGQLLNSGLILAGVRQGTSGPGEDGVLTALEVAGMDLWGTRLVVLSACETGLGGVKNGEGVYGLRRALVLAGSETQVMSLWKVSDAGTRDLMIAYFTLLQKGEGRVEALRQVQKAMLRGELLPGSDKRQFNPRDTGDSGDAAPTKDYRHPYYWAAFITSGDWRNLDGNEARSR